MENKRQQTNNKSRNNEKKNNRPTGYGDKKLVGPNRPAE